MSTGAAGRWDGCSRRGRRLCRTLLAVVLCAGLVACGAHVHHVVQKDETLYSISFRYKQDYRNVAAWNDLEPPYAVRPGQHLRVAPPRAPSHGERMMATRQAPSGGAPPERAGAGASPAPAPAVAVPAPGERVATPERGAVAIPLAPQPAPVRPAPPVTAPQPATPARAAAAGDPGWQWPIRRSEAAVRPARRGLEIRGVRGEPVHAAAEGRVVYSGGGIPNLGNLVIIKHDERFLSAYAHNERLLVAEGDQVRSGQTIAEMGDSGTDGVKLHFEIRLDGSPVDPLQYLPAR